MKRFSVLLSIGVLAASLAGAAPLAAEDARLVERSYAADEVVRIEGKMGVQATIGFGAGESIENVAVGDADKWQITPNKRADLLFVKPLEASARTNMTVVTDKHTYFFDLVASPSAKPIYMLRFTYGSGSTVASSQVPAPVAGPSEPFAAAFADAAAPAPAPAPAPAGAIDPALLNFAWDRKGTERLAPARLYDDGTATYLLFGQGQTVPTILVRGADGSEVPATYEKRGNTIVLPSVPDEIVLRGTRAMLTLRNLRNAASADAAPSTESEAPGEQAAAPAAVADAGGRQRDPR